MNKSPHPVFSAVLAVVLLSSAGCSVTPTSPADDSVAAPPASAEPASVATPPAVAAPVAPAVAVTPKSDAPRIEKPVAAKPPVKPAAAPAPKPQNVTPPPAPLALDTLEQRLKDTPAIGVFTKLTLKNQVDELLDRFRDHYAGRGGATLAQLRQSYDQLLGKVLGLLKDGDPKLAAAITQSREAIWNVLTDPAKFAKL